VLFSSLDRIKFLWNPPEQVRRAKLPVADMAALGWLTPSGFADVAREVIVRDILDPLATIGIVVTNDERRALFQG
jgi:hypothetical protein